MKVEPLDVELEANSTVDTSLNEHTSNMANNNDRDSKDAIDENAALKLKSMENPKLKCKKDPYGDVPMDPSVILAIVDSIPVYEIQLDKATSEVGVSRGFMSDTFGGNTQETFPRPRAAKLAEHGIDNFMFLSKDFNPIAPTMPGRGGLFYSIGAPDYHEEEDDDTDKKKKKVEIPEWPGTQKVFTRIQSNDWLYVGEYEMSYGKKLNKEEWLMQSKKVKSTWANQILYRGWGLHCRVRVSMRAQLGRPPTKAEFEDTLTLAEMEKNDFKHVTVEQIATAYEKGEECVEIWKMQCVDHDADFQRRLVNESQNWVKPPRKAKKGPTTCAGKKAKDIPKADTLKKVTSCKRKRSQDDDLDRDSSDKDEEVVVPVYRHRGTRSRPIAIN